MFRQGSRCSARVTHAPDEGFTLIEVIVATAVLVVVSTATAYILITALQTAAANEDRVVAASVARSELERLRTLGAVDIPAGLSTRTDAATGFVVATSATWVAVDQAANPCSLNATTTPGRSYVRVHVEVLGGRLGAPQIVDAIIPPLDDVPSSTTASITVAVRDQAGQPVEGAEVRASSTALGSTTQIRQTGFDGCVFFTGLVPGTWSVQLTVPPTQMVRPTTSATQTTAALTAGANAPLAFVLAQSVESVRLSAGGDAYPLPAGIPLQTSLDTWTSAAPTTLAPAGATITRTSAGLLWPDPAGYSARLGCNDAGAFTPIPVSPGGAATVSFAVKAVEIIGNAGETLTVSHAAESAPSRCTSGVTVTRQLTAAAVLPTGVGRTRLSLPPGTWTFSTPARPSRVVVLAPAAASPCLVGWPNSLPLGPDDQTAPLTSVSSLPLCEVTP